MNTKEKEDFGHKKYYIACWSPKGGSGKTTTCTQLAVHAKMRNRVVCLYDLDPQQTATFYFTKIGEKYRPQYILHDFNQAPPEDADFIILDCAPNVDFIPPDTFLIVAPTLASLIDLHSYRRVLALEKTHSIIKVINQFSLVRSDDKELLKELGECVVISTNTGIRHAMNNGKSIWNSGHPNGRKAKAQFEYLKNRIIAGKAEKMTPEKIMEISLGLNEE